MASRARRVVFWVLGIVVAVPVGLVALALLVILVGANTGPGRRLIEREASSLTGGKVVVDGLRGRFADALTLKRVTLRDHLGPYAVLDGIALDWRPLRLLHLTARVDRASIEHIVVLRRPAPDPNAKPAAPARAGGSSIPDLGIDIRSLHVGRLDLAAPVAGVAASVSIDGYARIAGIAPLLSGASVATLPDSNIALSVVRLDRAGRVSLAALVTHGKPGPGRLGQSRLGQSRLGLHVHADDPADGLVGSAGGLAELDPLHVALDLDGPRKADSLRLVATAGPVKLDATGIADLITEHFDIRAHGSAPAMQPRAGIAWDGLALDAHLLGTPRAPAGSGSLAVENLTTPGGGLTRLAANFSGAASGGVATGPALLHAVAEGLRIPGPQPALLADSPLTLDATLHNELAGHPVDLVLFHQLAQVTGRIFTAPSLHGSLGVTLPTLAPLAAAASSGAGGSVLDGNAAMKADFSYANGIGVVGLGSTFAITGGQQQAVGLIGGDGRLGLTASVAGKDLRLYGLDLHGRALDVRASGSDLADMLDARFAVRLPDLRAALSTLRGELAIDGTARGPIGGLSAKVDATGDVGTDGIPTGPLRLAVDASHLPNAPEGHLSLDGTLDRSPLDVVADVRKQADGGLHLLLDRLGWKSASGHADMILPAGATLPLGTFDLRMTRLADLSRVIGQVIEGSLAASIRTEQAPTEQSGRAGHPTLRADLRGSVATPFVHVGSLTLKGTVLDPAGSPDVDLALRADKIAGNGITGSARMTARGPRQALAVALTGAFAHVAGGPARVDTALVLDVPGKHVLVSRLLAEAKGEAIRLLAPARIGFGARMEVDRLRASVVPLSGGASPAMIDVAGKISPRLDLTASIANVTPALARPFAPSLDATGVIAANARLTGTMAKPDGTVHVSARGMRLRSGPGASLPAADLDAKAAIAQGVARIDARLDAGHDIALALAGTAPTSADGRLGLRARGMVDLAVANAVLGAQGRQAAGQVALDMGVSGTLKAPRLDGTVRLSNGQIQDFAQGIRLTGMTALVTAHGQGIRIDQFTAHAGPGTIDASGTVGALMPGLPVDLHLTASKARPLSSDLLTAMLDADITVKGQAASRLDVAGSVTIDSASINIPSGLPPTVAKLDVIRPGQKPPAAAAAGSGSVIGLDLALIAPGQIFVRGHGLDAELGGTLHVGGTTTAPMVSGGFDMRRGTLSLAGVDLTFTKGRVGFDGAGVTNKIDPSLDFTAESFVGSNVARLHVGGYADAPKITLSSTPTLPQDQVLALILFQQTTTQLSPLQIASLAAALAELSGVGGGGPGILGTVRSSLGLDRLSIGSGGANSTGASVEAGKYLARGVYVGAKQSTSGAGTQAEVQIDLTRRLKLETVVGTGGTVTGTTTPENDPGSSVGLKYQFQY